MQRKKDKHLKPSLGFAFPEKEERAIEYAKRLSESFMVKFGKGERPAKIDKRHYIQ